MYLALFPSELNGLAEIIYLIYLDIRVRITAKLLPVWRLEDEDEAEDLRAGTRCSALQSVVQ